MDTPFMNGMTWDEWNDACDEVERERAEAEESDGAEGEGAQ